MNNHNPSNPMINSDPPYVENIAKMALQNVNFRTTVWTGCHMQMTLMCIADCDEIGLEVHPYSDQIIRIEQGKAIFIPAGTWHNIINTEDTPLKISVIYASPNHPGGTVHRTKLEAKKAEY